MSDNPDVNDLYRDEDVYICENTAVGLIFFEDLHDSSIVCITPEVFEKAFEAWN